MFEPNFKISETLKTLLSTIDSHQKAISRLRMTPTEMTSLRESSYLASAHYATQIEGNLLSESQVKSVSKGGMFPNRSRDTTEVKNYFNALNLLVDIGPDKSADIREDDIRALNDLLMAGKKPDSYRDGQNVIRDSKNGKIVNAPPPHLLNDIITWVNSVIATKTLPIPIVAALAHYQIATIHPFYDGNGHVARLLTQLILHRSAFELHGIIVLEEHYASDIQAYYDAMTVDASHNFYFGRETADLTSWIEYFCTGMAQSFAIIEKKAKAALAEKPIKNEKHLLRNLDRRQQKLLSLFRKYRFLTTFEISELFNLHRRTSLNICKKWVEEGFLIQHGEAKKSRKYELADRWLSLI